MLMTGFWGYPVERIFFLLILLGLLLGLFLRFCGGGSAGCFCHPVMVGLVDYVRVVSTQTNGSVSIP